MLFHLVFLYSMFSVINSEPSDRMDQILLDSDTNLSKCGNIDIRELTVAKAQEYFKSGQLTSEELTKCYLKRIEGMNPYLKAVIEVNPDALKIAKEADAKRMNGNYQSTPGSLLGIPILIKDNMATYDQMQTTAGAIALEWVKPKSDSGVVKKLREAGAVIIGKSNPSEWAFFRGTNVPPRWSGRLGQTINPYNLAFDPSESSTGSAVAAASNLALVTLGTETDGSIITPSTVQSLVGLKTTVGCVPTDGVIPISVTQDAVGPMTRTVHDALLVFNAIANDDCRVPMDNFGCSNDTFKIGVLRNPYWNTSDALLSKHIPQLEIALQHLNNLESVTIIDPVEGNANVLSKVTVENEFFVLRYEFKDGVNKYLQDSVDHLEVNHGRKRMSTLADIIEFNKENPAPEGYNQQILIDSDATDGLQNATYLKTKEDGRKYAREYILGILDNPQQRLNAIATPCYSQLYNEHTGLDLHFSVSSIAGYPHITIPAVVDDNGVPIGICFSGRPNSEGTLLKIGSMLEKVYFQRLAPKFRLA